MTDDKPASPTRSSDPPAGSSPGANGSVPQRADRAHPHGLLTIYKYGQGYWVRMMTAIGTGLLALVMAAWAVKELEAYQPPAAAWTLTFSAASGRPAAGEAVVLQVLTDNKPVQIGTAVVQSSATAERATEGTVTLNQVVITDPTKHQPREVRRIEIGPAGSPTFTANISHAAPIALFNAAYIQMGVGAVLLVSGLALGWRLVASKPASVDFLIATDGEMRKVNWSTRRVIIDSTTVVIGATFLIASIIFVFDLFLRLVTKKAGIG